MRNCIHVVTLTVALSFIIAAESYATFPLAAEGPPSTADKPSTTEVKKTDATETDDTSSASFTNLVNDGRIFYRLYTGIEFNNRDEKDSSLFDDPTSFFILKAINRNVGDRNPEESGILSAAFSLFLEEKAKSDTNTTASASGGGGIDLEDRITSAETAGMAIELAYRPSWADSLFFSLSGELYFETDDPDEMITDGYLGFGFAPVEIPDDSNYHPTITIELGVAHLENLEESDRAYGRLQWEIRPGEQSSTRYGISSQITTPIDGGDGGDDFTIRLYIGFSPDKLLKVFDGLK